MRLALPLLLFSLLPAFGDQLVLPAQLGCGVYRVKGLLAERGGLDVLRVYPLTTAEYEIPVLGVPTDQSLALDDVYVVLEVEIFRTRDADPPRAKYRAVSARSNRHDVLAATIQKIQGAPCVPAPKPTPNH